MAQDAVRLFSASIIAHARAHQLAPSLVAGIIDVESGGDPNATSPDNGPGLGHALGLMQVLEGAFGPGQDGHDPETNLEAGCAMLQQKIAAFGGRTESGVAAYFGAVDAAGNPTDATDLTGTSGKRYVAEVLAAQQQFLNLDATPALGPAQADPDFAQYAPATGAWREAAINLKGIADQALARGRKLVELTGETAHAVKGEWGGL